MREACDKAKAEGPWVFIRAPDEETATPRPLDLSPTARLTEGCRMPQNQRTQTPLTMGDLQALGPPTDEERKRFPMHARTVVQTPGVLNAPTPQPAPAKLGLAIYEFFQLGRAHSCGDHLEGGQELRGGGSSSLEEHKASIPCDNLKTIPR